MKIVNAGPATADDVAINIRVEPIPQYPGGKYSGGHNKMIIPANDSREYFIQIHHPLTDAIMDGFKGRSWPLRVTGYFEHGQKRTEYCYKYYPFFEPRPEGLPQLFSVILIPASQPL